MFIDDLSQVPIWLKDGYRGILFLHRIKDGNNGNIQRKAFKKISKNAHEYTNAKEQLKDKILLEYPTKNGHHLITLAFNPNLYTGLQVKKDDLLYIG